MAGSNPQRSASHKYPHLLTWQHPQMIRSYSVRLMFLATCALTCKVSRDRDLKTNQIHERLGGVFNTLSNGLLVRIEHQLLEVLSWRIPMGDIYQLYANEIFRAASQALGRPVGAPEVLEPWVTPAETLPVKCKLLFPESASESSWSGTPDLAVSCHTDPNDSQSMARRRLSMQED